MAMPISRQQHGVLDYTVGPLISIAPEIMGFESEKTAAGLCRAISSSSFISAFSTKAEWGALKIMPFKVHCIVDIAMGVFSAAAPWVFGFSRNKKARNTFLAIGALSILAGALSQQDDEMITPDALQQLKDKFNNH
ncbi:MAG: SPW repeat protein [Williamsia sp.]|nr:SPW repeat protein [Williamsia sp.]